MSDTVIKVEQVSKKYLLSHRQPERYVALRDVMTDGVRRLGHRLFRSNDSHRACNAAAEEFYALKDLSLHIDRGDRVGIIGRNGAGKSTLLKILSRITHPTTGRITIKGRVASLLEVGTGFHPELTGRENIFLNGAILGMTKAEIRKNFDAIVAFAEIEKFLDTPVKRYSSGMYVRLAFAVAAHLENEILLVDEVLAVGDAGFQKKCLGKMSEAGASGKTILFVSHNMGALSSLCRKGLLLERGRTAYFDEIEPCINTYIASWSDSHERVINLADRKRTAPHHLRHAAQLREVEMVSASGDNGWQTAFAKNPVFRVRVTVSADLPTLELGMALYNNHSVEIASSLSSDSLYTGPVGPGSYEFIAEFSDLLLLPGAYSIGLGLKSGLSDMIMEDYIQEAACFEVTPTEVSAGYRSYTRRGAFIPRVKYTVQQAGSCRC